MFSFVKIFAIDYSGTYSFSKGMNKARAYLYFFQINEQKAFFYISAISGNPDFLMTNMKGFVNIDSSQAVYKKDSCEIIFRLNKSLIEVSQNNKCHEEFSLTEKYKKINNPMKTNSGLMLEYSEKNGVIKMDSCEIYFAPSLESNIIKTAKQDMKIKILDEVNGFYLIDILNKKNEFSWVQKKNVILSK